MAPFPQAPPRPMMLVKFKCELFRIVVYHGYLGLVSFDDDAIVIQIRGLFCPIAFDVFFRLDRFPRGIGDAVNIILLLLLYQSMAVCIFIDPLVRV